MKLSASNRNQQKIIKISIIIMSHVVEIIIIIFCSHQCQLNIVLLCFRFNKLQTGRHLIVFVMIICFLSLALIHFKLFRLFSSFIIAFTVQIYSQQSTPLNWKDDVRLHLFKLWISAPLGISARLESLSGAFVFIRFILKTFYAIFHSHGCYSSGN